MSSPNPPSATGPPAGGGRPPGPPPAAQREMALENRDLSQYLLITCASLAAALVIWRVSTRLLRHVRTVACLSNDTQRYFAIPSTKLSFLKKNVLYAPIFRKRHNREFQFSSAVNVGTLPTRLELFLLAGYFAANIAFCLVRIDFSENFSLAATEFRNRTGTIAVVNMVPLFLLAGRNNPLIVLLGIPFDTFNLLHRWIGRIVVLESLAHSITQLVMMSRNKGFDAAVQTILRVPYMTFGFVATCAVIAISLQAASPVRHAFYETFKLLHVGLAILFVVGLWYHLKLEDLVPQMRLLGIAIPFWVVDRVLRIVRLVYRNLGRGGTRTMVEALPGNACRVTVTLARPWSFRPGQHAYLYIPSLGFWQSHPFSVAWAEDDTDLSVEKLAMSRQDVLASKKTTMSFVVRARTGFTNTLYRKAIASPDNRFVTRCLVEGPYGDLHTLHSYGTVMLFAGGIGITHQVPYIRDLVVGYANGTVATRKLVLVWVIQSPEHLEWIRPWMTEILAMEKRREVLRIMLFVSRPRSTKEIHSPSATVQMFPGRPNIDTLVGIEMEQQVGAMAVTVCGPGSLSDEVRRAVRNRQYQGHISLIEEAFSW